MEIKQGIGRWEKVVTPGRDLELTRTWAPIPRGDSAIYEAEREGNVTLKADVEMQSGAGI